MRSPPSLLGLRLQSTLNPLPWVGQSCVQLYEALLLCPWAGVAGPAEPSVLQLFPLAFQMEHGFLKPSLVPCLCLPFLLLMKSPYCEFTACTFLQELLVCSSPRPDQVSRPQASPSSPMSPLLCVPSVAVGGLDIVGVGREFRLLTGLCCLVGRATVFLWYWQL